MLKTAILTTLGFALCGIGQAGTLLTLTNPADTSGTPYSLTFVAGGGMTDISFAGFQAPEREWAEDISLTSGGGNLLGTMWEFTPYIPADTTDAGQFNDGFGTGTNGLYFANGVGFLDRFDQVVTTVPGQTYTLDFDFINDPAHVGSSPSELIVSETTAPEPASGILVALAFAGLAVLGWNKRMKNNNSAAEIGLFM